MYDYLQLGDGQKHCGELWDTYNGELSGYYNATTQGEDLTLTFSSDADKGYFSYLCIYIRQIYFIHIMLKKSTDTTGPVKQF